MGVMFYPLDHLLMHAASITGNLETKVNLAFFFLACYGDDPIVSAGVEELYQEKLAALLQLKYHGSIADAVADLGRPEDIGKAFAGFQKYLYQTS